MSWLPFLNMPRSRLYYEFKPYLPWRLRIALRRTLAISKRRSFRDTWPIHPAAGHTPEGWPGWPEGKKFAFVLTHDVEGEKGLTKCRELMKVDQQLGFRASFNFVPEGDYLVSRELRDELTNNGFEVGVHDLHHDGKLYRTRAEFARKAVRINQYIKEWGASGFRSAFMHHNLDWAHDLDVQYDASTFDTDPFEPQPEGVDTIFPFWVPRPSGPKFGGSITPCHQLSTQNSQPLRNGYVELPYTLAQDSTLFIILGERTIDVWKRKLDWIVEHGGMALLDTHPDYINFSGKGKGASEYPVSLYREFLDYVRSKYAGQYWHATSREVAGYVKSHVGTLAPAASSASVSRNKKPSPKREKIWIDLDNTPHVPLFAPIVKELSARGYEVVLTARDAFQVCELAEKMGLDCLKIGRHHGKNRLRKLSGLFYRAAQLAPVALREKPVLGLSHGSRSQLIICNLLRIPTMLMADYEFAEYPPLMRPTWEVVPEVIPDSALYCAGEKIRKYPGIKEDVYVPGFLPDSGLLKELHLNENDRIIVVRPPATEAHYHNPESEGLFVRFMDRACRIDSTRVVLLPRNKKQGDLLRKDWPYWFTDRRTIIPEQAVDGLNLLWHSDLVVSGGGTMNREAAALGVPVYSVFRGKIGAVDQQLQKEGRLTLVESLEDVDRIALPPQQRSRTNGAPHPAALSRIVEHIEEAIAFHSRARS